MKMRYKLLMVLLFFSVGMMWYELVYIQFFKITEPKVITRLPILN